MMILLGEKGRKRKNINKVVSRSIPQLRATEERHQRA